VSYPEFTHALVYREWKNRVKGRDWYDFEWYVRHKTPLDFAHFQERALQFNHEEIAKDNFIARLKERLATTDIKMVKADVLPFIQNEKDLSKICHNCPKRATTSLLNFILKPLSVLLTYHYY